MSAFESLTEKQAETEARSIDGYVASYRGVNGRFWYAARTRHEAQGWINFNRDYMYAGSDEIHKHIAASD